MKFRVYEAVSKQMLSYEDLYKRDCSNELPFLAMANGVYNTTNFEGKKEYHVMTCLGIQDANKQDIYTMDVLSLKITEQLMETMFVNSNLGKACKELAVTEVIVTVEKKKGTEIHYYSVYFKDKNGYLKDDDDDIECMAKGYDAMFLQYVCEKGACVIGNMYQNSKLIPF